MLMAEVLMHHSYIHACMPFLWRFAHDSVCHRHKEGIYNAFDWSTFCPLVRLLAPWLNKDILAKKNLLRQEGRSTLQVLVLACLL